MALGFKQILIVSATLFSVVLVLNILVWRLTKPDRGSLFVLAFFTVPIIALVCLTMSKKIFIVDALILSICYCSLSLSYILSFPALVKDIPSIVILRLVQRAEKISINELTDKFRKTMPSDNTGLKELLNEKMVILSNGELTLTKSGRIIAKTFYWYRRIMRSNRPQG